MRLLVDSCKLSDSTRAFMCLSCSASFGMAKDFACSGELPEELEQLDELPLGVTIGCRPNARIESQASYYPDPLW